jgi:hypothetical protein
MVVRLGGEGSGIHRGVAAKDRISTDEGRMTAAKLNNDSLYGEDDCL